MKISEILKQKLMLILPKCEARIVGNRLHITDLALVGDARIDDCNNHIFINQIFITKARQRQKLGTALLAAIELACKECSYGAIKCRPTSGGELHGEDFCLKLGFNREGDSGVWVKPVAKTV